MNAVTFPARIASLDDEAVSMQPSPYEDPLSRHVCEICGLLIRPHRAAGRPKQRCSSKCSEIASLLTRLELRFDAISLSGQASRVMRSRLWYIANKLNRRRNDT